MSRQLCAGNSFPSCQLLPNITCSMDSANRLTNTESTSSCSPRSQSGHNSMQQVDVYNAAVNIPLPKASSYYMLARRHASSFSTRPKNMVRHTRESRLCTSIPSDNTVYTSSTHIDHPGVDGARDGLRYRSASSSSTSHAHVHYSHREPRRMQSRAALHVVKDMDSVLFTFANNDARERVAASPRDNISKAKSSVSLRSQSICDLSIARCSLLPCSRAIPSTSTMIYDEQESSSSERRNSLWSTSFCRFMENKSTPLNSNFSKLDGQVGCVTTQNGASLKQPMTQYHEDSFFFYSSAVAKSENSMQDNISPRHDSIMFREGRVRSNEEDEHDICPRSPIQVASLRSMCARKGRDGGELTHHASPPHIEDVYQHLAVEKSASSLPVERNGNAKGNSTHVMDVESEGDDDNNNVVLEHANELHNQSDVMPSNMALSTTCDLSWSADCLNSDSFYSDEVKSIIIPELAERFVRDGAQRHYTHVHYQK